MTEEDLRRLLRGVRRGTVGTAAALKQLAALPFEDLGYAKVDRHRALRQGFPEVVFAQGKTAAQVAGIARSLLRDGQPLLVTRLSPEQLPALREVAPRGRYNPGARLFQSGRARAVPGARVAVLSAGTADLPIAEEAALTAWSAGCTVDRHYDVGVAGLHRLLSRRSRIERARALVVVGGLSRRPVIAVPTSVGYGTHLGGLAPLLAMLSSCTPNVAVVNVDNGFGGGFMASVIAKRQ